jgi:hypothetical protein
MMEAEENAGKENWALESETEQEQEEFQDELEAFRRRQTPDEDTAWMEDEEEEEWENDRFARGQRKGKYPEKFKTTTPDWKVQLRLAKKKADKERTRLKYGDKSDKGQGINRLDDDDFDDFMYHEPSDSDEGAAMINSRVDRQSVGSTQIFDNLSDTEDDNSIPPDETWVTEEVRPKPSLAKRLETSTGVYTAEKSTAQHSAEHKSRYYEIDSEVLDRMPPFYRERKGFNAELTLKSHYMMVREPGMKIVQRMKAIDQEGGNALLGVCGMRGSGKSTTLHYATQYALEKDWLVVGCDGEDFPSDLLGMISYRCTKATQGSELHEYNVYNQPKLAARFFETLIKTQGANLAKIDLKGGTLWDWVALGDVEEEAVQAATEGGEATTSRGDESEDTDDVDIDFEYVDEDELAALNAEAETEDLRVERLKAQAAAGPKRTLLDLATLAVVSSEQVNDIVYDFVNELKLATEVPVLVVIDSLNRWDHKTQFHNPVNLHKKLLARQLSLVDAFSEFQTTAPKNGMTLFALSSSARQILGQHYLDQADEVIRVLPYDSHELKQCVLHYKAHEVIASKVDPWFLARTKGFSGGVPRDVYDVAILS